MALAEAIADREDARSAVERAEVVVSNARRIEADAVAEAAQHALTELSGADALARQILEWSQTGGERPHFEPDTVTLDARRARDRAHVHADAARQAAVALTAVLDAKRAALVTATAAVSNAARVVVEATAERIAEDGEIAERVFKRARDVSLALSHATKAGAGPFSVVPIYQIRPATRRVGGAYHLGEAGHHAHAIESATGSWAALLRALETDPNAALGLDF